MIKMLSTIIPIFLTVTKPNFVEIGEAVALLV